jgi:hypothetical protein
VGDGKLLIEVGIAADDGLAAHELRTYVEEMPEVRLNTVDHSDDTFPVRIFEGKASTRTKSELPQPACPAKRKESFPVKTGSRDALNLRSVFCENDARAAKNPKRHTLQGPLKILLIAGCCL